MGLSFTIAAGPRQRSHSRVQVLRDSSHSTVSDRRLPQPGGPGLRIYIPQEQDGRVKADSLLPTPLLQKGHASPKFLRGQ
jgi:hypothetical protein